MTHLYILVFDGGEEVWHKPEAAFKRIQSLLDIGKDVTIKLRMAVL